MGTRRHRTDDQKATRVRARWTIVNLANKHRLALGLNQRVYSPRHIHQCVFIARRHNLVSATVLQAAGFRAAG